VPYFYLEILIKEKTELNLNISSLQEKTYRGDSMSSVSEVNSSNWENEILHQNALVVVDFWHTQCSWCKLLEPIFTEVAEEYKGKVKFAKLNVSESKDNRNIAVKYGVWGTPTLAFFCAGKLVGSLAGFRPKEGLKKLVDDNLQQHQCTEKCTEL